MVCTCLQLDPDISKTTLYQKTVNNKIDFRALANSRKEPQFAFDSYTQVFGLKHGFIPNLSILDLLFNEGPNSIQYLENQFKHL